MPLIIPCSTPLCLGLTDTIGGLCRGCQAAVDACPNCGRHGEDFDLRETVRVDGVEYGAERVERLSPGNHWRGRTPGRAQYVPLVFVERKDHEKDRQRQDHR